MQLLTTVRNGSLTALRVAIRVENELVQDGGQTAAHDGTQPINLETINRVHLVKKIGFHLNILIFCYPMRVPFIHYESRTKRSHRVERGSGRWQLFSNLHKNQKKKEH